MDERAEDHVMTGTSPRPNLGRGIVSLARAWIKGVPPIGTNAAGNRATILVLPLSAWPDVDAFARRVLSLADDGSFLAFLASEDLPSPVRDEMAAALASFADKADASLALDADAFEVALQSAFREFLRSLRDVRFPLSHSGTRTP